MLYCAGQQCNVWVGSVDMIHKRIREDRRQWWKKFPIFSQRNRSNLLPLNHSWTNQGFFLLPGMRFLYLLTTLCQFHYNLASSGLLALHLSQEANAVAAVVRAQPSLVAVVEAENLTVSWRSSVSPRIVEGNPMPERWSTTFKRNLRCKGLSKVKKTFKLLHLN